MLGHFVHGKLKENNCWSKIPQGSDIAKSFWSRYPRRLEGYWKPSLIIFLLANTRNIKQSLNLSQCQNLESKSLISCTVYTNTWSQQELLSNSNTGLLTLSPFSKGGLFSASIYTKYFNSNLEKLAKHKKTDLRWPTYNAKWKWLKF